MPNFIMGNAGGSCFRPDSVTHFTILNLAETRDCPSSKAIIRFHAGAVEIGVHHCDGLGSISYSTIANILCEVIAGKYKQSLVPLELLIENQLEAEKRTILKAA